MRCTNHFLVLFLALPDRLPFVAAEDSEPAGKLTGSRISMLQPLQKEDGETRYRRYLKQGWNNLTKRPEILSNISGDLVKIKLKQKDLPKIYGPTKG